MKIKSKRITAVLLAAALMLPVFTLAGAADAATTQSGAAEQLVVKDETVYFLLGNDGAVSSVQVVNRIDTPIAGKYTDYGEYSNVKPLTSDVAVKKDGEKLVFDLPADDGGFYYQGTLENAAPPFIVSMEWALDGEPIDANTLLGKSGHVTIHGKIEANESAGEYFGKHMMCQLQMPLSMDICRNIESASAQSVISGRLRTLAFMVLPGGKTEFDVSFDAERFEFDGMMATCSPFDMTSLIDLGPEITKLLAEGKDISELTDGLSELTDGTAKLRDGLVKLDDGLQQLSEGGAGLSSGVSEYTAGIAKLSNGLSKLSSSMPQLKSGGTALNENYAKLSDGINQLLGMLDLVIETMAPEQLAQYEQELALMKGETGKLKEGLTAFGGGLKSYTDGVSKAADGVSGIAGGAKKLGEGGVSIASGAKELSDGITAAAAQTGQLPNGASAILDGQKQISDAIGSLVSAMSGMSLSSPGEPMSYVRNSGDAKVRSVQFVMKTPEIRAVSPIAESKTEQPKNESFWDKLMALFGA